jgi:hypothetical protein
MSIAKGLFYIFWLLIVTVSRIGISLLLLQLLGNQRNSNPNIQTRTPICNYGDFLPYDNTLYSTFVLCFTFFYLTMPMYISNNVNYPIIIFFIIYILFDIGVKIKNSCLNLSSPNTNALGNIFVNIAGGGGLGAIIASIIYFSPINYLLFTNELSSNKEVCSMPSKQKFKCSVYKNGELVNTTTR